MTIHEHYRVNPVLINKICFDFRGQLVQLHVCLHRETQVLATGVAEYFVLFLVTEKWKGGKPDCNPGKVVLINNSADHSAGGISGR